MAASREDGATAVRDSERMEGCGLLAITDRAQENRAYVRRLLRKRQPEFAALLESVETWAAPSRAGTGPERGPGMIAYTAPRWP
jgi:hypothetical protein